MFMFKLLGSFEKILVVLDGLPSRVNKHKHLFAASDVTQHNVVAFVIVDVSDVSVSRNVVVRIFWVFHSDEMRQQGNRSKTRVEVEKASFTRDPQEVSNVHIIG